MQKYKLYKVTVEREFVIAAPAELAIEDVEKSVDNIMVIHSDSMVSEPCTHVLAQEIRSAGDLPRDWEVGCLPYTNHTTYSMPRELINKTIENILNENGIN